MVLGVIDPDYFLGGRIPLRRDLAEDAIRRHIAEPLGMTVTEAAAGIRSVADNQMADLLRKVTVEQGHDPRDFVLFAYGGAGPTHAYAFAREAGIGTIVVPPRRRLTRPTAPCRPTNSAPSSLAIRSVPSALAARVRAPRRRPHQRDVRGARGALPGGHR